MEQVKNIVEYDLTQAQLNQLAVDYDPANIPEAKAVGDEGYNLVHERVMAITKVRTRIEKKRKELKKDALEWGRKVDSEAKRLTGLIEDLESPWRQVKLNLEEAERKAAEAKIAAAQKRQAKIEESIANIRVLSEGLINATAATIEERIKTLESLVLTEEVYGEFVEAAQVTGDIVGKALRVALAERVEFEKSQAALKAEQDKIREEQEKLKQGQRELANALAAKKAAEEAVEAEKAAAAKREADEIRAREEAQAKAEYSQRKYADRHPSLASLIPKVWGQKPKADQEAEMAYLQARLPEDKLVVEYVTKLAMVEVPVIEDPHLVEVLATAHHKLAELVEEVYSNTQGGE
jgi:hypothetical protein